MEQLVMNLTSNNVGIVTSKQLESWLLKLPDRTRVFVKENAEEKVWHIYIYDKDDREQLKVIFRSTKFNDIEMELIDLSINDNIINDVCGQQVTEADLAIIIKLLER